MEISCYLTRVFFFDSISLLDSFSACKSEDILILMMFMHVLMVDWPVAEEEKNPISLLIKY